MTPPTPEQEAQYAELIKAGADPDVAAYLTGIDECNCVIPEQVCRICRGAAKTQNASYLLVTLLALVSNVHVCSVYGMIIVDSGLWHNPITVDIGDGVRALVASGHYREWSCHIGGRTTPMHVAEPVTGKATGPTFTSMHPEPWKAVRE